MPGQAEDGVATFPSSAGTQAAEAAVPLILPVGTVLPVHLQTPVDTQRNQPGDPIAASLAVDIFLGQRLALPRSARLLGWVEMLEAPFKGRNARAAFRFSTLQLPDGAQLPFRGYVRGEHPDHSFGGELTPGTKPHVVTHRVQGIGEYNQLRMLGPRQMGTHRQFLPGERWMIILEAPLRVPYKPWF